MRKRVLSPLVIGLPIVLLAQVPVSAQDVPVARENVDVSREHYSPHAGRNFPTVVLWGETHLHTSNSLDARAAGVTLSPEQAYRFARGEEVTATHGERLRLSRPLNFLVVTDHSDAMGVMNEVVAGNPDLMRDPKLREWHEQIAQGGQTAINAALEIVETFAGVSGESMPEAATDPSFVGSVWPLRGAPQQYRLIPQAGKPVFSKLTSWESPDPNFWVPSGYAVVNMNSPGYANSGGPPSAFSEHQGKCYYEAIEWVAKQPWCTGKVGLNGVSFLAITQYHVAACQAYGGPPPSLCCISPWEGLPDPYRDIFAFGGLPEIGFPAFWWATEVKPVIHENEWPIARTAYRKLYLTKKRYLSLERSQTPAELAYSAKKGKAEFHHTFPKDIELSGYMKLRVWVEARPEKAGQETPDDIGLFVAVNKLDRDGDSVHFYGSVGNTKDMVTRGWLRVALRELDPVESTEWLPVQKGAREQKLNPGEIVPVDIALYPSSTFFAAGETLQLIVASHEIIPSPPYFKDASLNRGTHVLHFGGEYDSYLLVPKV